MKRSMSLVAMALCALLLTVGQAAAAGSKLADAMGNLRWGMSESDVMRVVGYKLKEDYGDRIKKARGGRKDSLSEEMNDKLRGLKKSVVRFDGKRSSWDASQIAGEFTHGNGETMVFVKDGKSQTYYFFINGGLWKWIKVFDASTFGGKNFKKFQKMVGKKFGNGMVKSGQRLDGVNKEQTWVEFLDRNSRLRAVDETKFYGSYALVFEQMETVRDLASLRSNTIRRNQPKNSAVARAVGGDRDADESGVVDKITGKDRRNAGRLSKRRSLFAEEKEQETQAEYERRVKREQASQRAKQRRAHERKKSKERGKALAGVGGGDDPLGGL